MFNLVWLSAKNTAIPIAYPGSPQKDNFPIAKVELGMVKFKECYLVKNFEIGMFRALAMISRFTSPMFFSPRSI